MALSHCRALLFDVFGTCVDWRTTVTDALVAESKSALTGGSGDSISSEVRSKASSMTAEDWGKFAQEWRNSYYKFTRAVAADPGLRWKTVDDHHLESLRDLLAAHGLVPLGGEAGGLWDEAQVKDMSLVWHRLAPWPDTVRGLEALNTKYETCTLSNGNISLLTDMAAHGSMPFKHIYSSELFGSYKPNPAIYNGAAERLGIATDQCIMVAAHLGDLEAAKKCGYRTIYVERPQEEAKDVEAKAKHEGYVDIWISAGDDGFVTAARRLDIAV
ncbi:hypothetical protein MBLNU459_g2215t1 [Dothideomycetes sp. NU459]